MPRSAAFQRFFCKCCLWFPNWVTLNLDVWSFACLMPAKQTLIKHVAYPNIFKHHVFSKAQKYHFRSERKYVKQNLFGWVLGPLPHISQQDLKDWWLDDTDRKHESGTIALYDYNYTVQHTNNFEMVQYLPKSAKMLGNTTVHSTYQNAERFMTFVYIQCEHSSP